MGLSRLEIGFLQRALAAGAIPSGGDVLELGESVVVSNVNPLDLLEMLRSEVPTQRYDEACKRMTACATAKSDYQIHHGPARALYYAIFEPRSYVAVDIDLGPGRICADLNRSVSLNRQFDCTINNSTSEYIFDQGNVFEFLEHPSAAGGVMVHWTPGLGWINHGLYNVQPGFFFDLAMANGYEIKHIELGHPDAASTLQSGPDFARAMADQPV